ncbi:ATP-binding protein [Haladaptatus sp. DYSN1]|uniref:ATP-binding protein n=1 Tax=unclassified Haladaptatus TaxID=2622732 RepID=UPI0024053328|nr:ATP-binding protein [Haladaptatus sp. DYSN1]
MTSFQSTLGEGEGIAEELAQSQREISIAEFFEKNKHMLGFDSGARGLVTAVKEAVDNALDATEEAGILPDIYVEIAEVGDYYRLIIEDNGPGITGEQIPKVFGKLLYGSRFHKREQSLTPSQRILVNRDGTIEFIPIGVLCDAYLPQEGAETVPVSDDITVPSFTRDDHTLSWQPITHVIRHETTEQTYKITTEKGRTVEVTGNHSVFSVTKDGNTKEVKASELDASDTILAPRKLPRFGETVEEVNLLEHITREQLTGRNLYVYGFDEETLQELQTGDTVRRKPSSDSSRKRYYYQYNGVEILKDSLDQNYIRKGYLPAEKVLELGWEHRASDCELKTYKVGGKETTIPVTISVDDAFVELLAYYISEGHVGPRQVGFTFGSHESELIQRTERAVAGLTGSATTVERERNSTRVKAFGSPLSMFLQAVCGDSSASKRIPDFVFHLSPELQQRFIAALYEGDGSDSHPTDELSHTTTSETLARQLSVLWNMQGVLASSETVENHHGYADEPATVYRTKVYGGDVNLSSVFSEKKRTGEQQYKRLPVSLLADLQVGPVTSQTVPDTIPGLLMGAGVGSSIEHAEVYQALIEKARSGEYVDKPRYVHNLKQKGLLDEEHNPTAQLEALWGTIQNLHGFTETDMCLLPVKSVEKTEPPAYVYDISVPGVSGHDENFVVANDGALSVKNSRGQQGIGISAAVLYSQLTSGKPAKITSRTKGSAEAKYFELIIDTDTNEPEIQTERTTTWDRPHGTRIELEMEANMRARANLHSYIKHTAVVNPHARIEMREPEESFKFERATDQLPAETEEIRPHPHGVELGTLLKMLDNTASHSVSGFLQEEFTRVGKKTTESILANFSDRHFGREMAWTPPQAHEQETLHTAIEEAVVNKGETPTDSFATEVTKRICAMDRVSYSNLVRVVGDVADETENTFDPTFGKTVRKNAVAAAWDVLTENRAADLYGLVDEATTSRKDDAVVQALAERIAAKFEADDNERDRATLKTLKSYVDRAADMTKEREDATVGETARTNIVESLWRVMKPVQDDLPSVKEVAGNRDFASELLEGMREADIMSPPTTCLSPITDDLVLAGLKKEFEADFYSAATRDADVHGGDPFIVEAGIAYGGNLPAEGTVELLRFANRVPLVYQQGACTITEVTKSIGWRNYGLDQPGGSGLPKGPAVIMVHVASTNVPFTSESKDALANVPEIHDEIELAIREAARELKSYLKKRRSLQKRQRKQDVLASILPKMATKLSDVTGRPQLVIDDSMARIMNNVLVERSVEDGTVEVVVENHSNVNANLEITDIVNAEPTNVSKGATVIEMDGEWFVKWAPEVSAGDDAVLKYTVADEDASFDLNVTGVENERLTVNA